MEEKTVYDRTRMLVGTDMMKHFKSWNIIVFGVGGVGGFTIEALARAGVGRLTIVDFDTVDLTNINRQIIALHSTVGRQKTEVMKERIADINPAIEVTAVSARLTSENLGDFRLETYDYIVDAIDDVKAKLLLIQEADRKAVPILCSMGTGNKFDPSQFRIGDIKNSHTCPLARVIRKEVKSMGIKKLKVLFSTEPPHREEFPEDGSKSPASISFGPATAGLLIASEVVRDLMISAPTTERKMFGVTIKQKQKIEEYEDY